MRLLIILFLVASATFAFGQPASITVDGKKFDDDLIQSIKQLQPDFGLTGDSVEIFSKVLKFYTYRKYVAELAHRQGFDTIYELATKLAVAKQVMEEKLIAEYYGEFINAHLLVSEEEARQYYNAEKERYTTPGKCDVIYIETADTSKKAMTELRKIAEEAATMPERERMSLKKYNEVYLMKNYQISTGNKQYPFLKEMIAAKLKSWIGPFFSKEVNRYVYYFVIAKQEETYTPFESVKELCIQNIRSRKFSSMTEQWKEEAVKKYPIQITPGTIEEKDPVKIFYH